MAYNEFFKYFISTEFYFFELIIFLCGQINPSNTHYFDTNSKKNNFKFMSFLAEIKKGYLDQFPKKQIHYNQCSIEKNRLIPLTCMTRHITNINYNLVLIDFIKIIQMNSESHHFIESLEQQCTCPISKAQMLDPVITADGHTYERQAIAQWLERQNKSPITNLPLENTKLIPNLAFKNLTQKLYAELPAYFAKEQALLTEISQLQEEITFLKEELEHEKQRNEELQEKQEKEFKTKRIQKQRHDHKNDQLKTIRQQKNTYQRQLQELRAKEQQQSRQILSLKSELANFTDLFEKASAGQRKYTELYKKVNRNRQMVLFKLEFSFASNLTFIGHLLQSIEDAKKFETQKQKEKGSQLTIGSMNDMKNETQLSDENPSIIQRLQEIIREKVNRQGIDMDDQKPEGQAANNLIERLRIHPHRRRLFGLPGIPLRMRLQRNNQANPQINNPAENLQNNQILPQANNDQQAEQVRQPMILENQPNQIQANENAFQKISSNDKIHRDTQLYKQLLSIKWMMSKRNYTEIPEFYNYKVCKNNDDPDIYWYGVKLSILESRIPFVEFLPYSWNHVRWLDFSSSNVDDVLWRQFIDSAHNFRSLMFINAYRNKIENIKSADLKKFPCLVKFVVLRNKLKKESIDELKEYSEEHPKVKIEFSNEQEMMDQEGQEVRIFGFDD